MQASRRAREYIIYSVGLKNRAFNYDSVVAINLVNSRAVYYLRELAKTPSNLVMASTAFC